MAPRRNKSTERKIAAERIDILFKAASEIYKTDPSLSRRYVELSGKIAMKYRIKIPKRYKLNYCRKCMSYLYPGENTRTRINNGKISVTCRNCGYIRRYPVKEKNEKYEK